MSYGDCWKVNPLWHKDCQAVGRVRVDVSSGRPLVVCDHCLCVASIADTYESADAARIARGGQVAREVNVNATVT